MIVCDRCEKPVDILTNTYQLVLAGKARELAADAVSPHTFWHGDLCSTCAIELRGAVAAVVSGWKENRARRC